MIEQILVALAIGALEVLVFSVFVKRILAKRDANRWIPFRRYLLQVLYDESLNEMDAAHTLSNELKSRLEADHTPELWPETLMEMIEASQRGVASLKASRHAVYQAIQTAAPSLTSEAAANFTNIFRALDNGPLLVEALAGKLRELSSFGVSEPTEFRRRVSEAQSTVSGEGIKLLGGVSYLVRDVESLLDQHGYVVIEGLVSTPDDVLRRRHVEAVTDEARRRFARATTG